MERILAIGTHIDDIEIGCGGTLLNYSKKAMITLAILHADDFRGGSESERRVEQQQANLISNPINCSFYSQHDNIEIIIGKLGNVKPTIIYYMWDKDYHQNHKLSSIVGRAIGRRYECDLIAYGSCTSYDFTPNLYHRIDWKKKKELISNFKSQLSRRPKYMEMIEARDRYYGSLLPGVGLYAEGFVIERMVVK